MGVSVAASSAILFVGFLFVATALFTGLNATLHEMEESFREAQDMQVDISRTSITVENATNNTTHVFVNITNSGSSPLKVSELQVLINGTLLTDSITYTTVEGNQATDIWAPAEVLYIETAYSVKGTERVWVISGNGVSHVGVLT